MEVHKQIEAAKRKGDMRMSREPLVKLEYQEGKDGMMYPKVQISENREHDQRATGLFGSRWKDYMKEKHPQRLSELIAQGKINEVICQVDEEAEAKKEKLIQQLLEVQPMHIFRQRPRRLQSVAWRFRRCPYSLR